MSGATPVDDGRVTVCARVERVQDGALHVTPARTEGACPGCEGGCTRARLFDWWGAADRPLVLPLTLVPAPDREALAAGTRLRLALPERALVLASALTYLAPLLGLVAGTLAAAALLGPDSVLTVPAGLGGLAVGWLWGRRLSRRWLPPLTVELDRPAPALDPGPSPGERLPAP
jgi:positive regulator of sigma E activity